MAGSTVISIGGSSVTVNGGVTGAALASINAAIAASSVVAVDYTSGPVPAPGNGAIPDALIIQAGATGTVTIPTGYEYVVNLAGDNVTLTGGDPSTVIWGDLTYVGDAGTVLATQGSGVLYSTAGNSALLSVYDGAYTVAAFGDSDSIAVDGGNSTVYAIGDNNAITIGAGNSGGDTTQAGPSEAAVSMALFGTGDTVSLMSGTNVIFDVNGGTQFDAMGGSNVINSYNGTDTVNITGGDDTVRAVGDANMLLNNGSNLVAANWGAGAMTVTGAGTSQIYAANGTVDLMTTGATSVIALGGDSTVDGSGAGSTTFIALDNINGDTTLTGGAGNDVFQIWNTAAAGLTATITITNWTSGDQLVLGNYSQSDIDSANSQLASGGSVTLSDGLQITFVGAHPGSVA